MELEGINPLNEGYIGAQTPSRNNPQAKVKT